MDLKNRPLEIFIELDMFIYFIKCRKVLRIVPKTAQELQNLTSLETDYGLEVCEVFKCSF